MKGLRLLLAAHLWLMCLGPISGHAAGIISFGTNGTGILDFSQSTTTPPTNGWSTLNIAGGGITWSDGAAIDTAVESQTAAGINLALPHTSTYPPSTSLAGFRYNITSLAIQSRPEGDAGVILLGTFQNDSGWNQSTIVISYDFAKQTVMAGEIPGWRVYYSLTGASGSWTPIADLSGNVTVGRQSSTNTLSGTWNTGKLLYLLWVDDNANGVADESYTMDNFELKSGECELGSISTQPHSVTVQTCRETNLTVAVSGRIFGYQWYHDNIPITGANTPTYAITNAQAADAGTYFVRITTCDNALIDSDPITVTVKEDSDAPTVVSAVVRCGNTLHVSFSEKMDEGTAAQADAYSLVGVDCIPGTSRTGSSAVLTNNGTNLIITLDGPLDPKNYELLIYPSMTDCYGNPLSPVSADGYVHIKPTYEVCLLSISGTSWKYADDGLSKGTAWRADPYDEVANGFKDGTSLFDGKRPFPRTCVSVYGCLPVATQLPLTNSIFPDPSGIIPGYYFRTHFTAPSMHVTEVILTALVDDYVTIWVNSQDTPFFHYSGFGNTNTDLDAYTYAGYTHGTDPWYESHSSVTNGIDPTRLNIPGDNFVAARLWQGTSGSSDVTFGLDLIARTDYFGPPLVIFYSSNQVTVTWNDGCKHLAEADDPQGPWNPISGAEQTCDGLNCSYSTTLTTNAFKFYSLREELQPPQAK